MAARVAAARAVAEALTLARPLDERLAADLALRAGGLDARDRALARSIATVALRRLGTIRKALARRMEKGMPKRGGALEWMLIVAAAQILFLDTPDHAAVDLAVKATRADPASAPFAALANAVLRDNRARPRRDPRRAPIRSTTIRPPGSPSAGARPTARARHAPSPRRTARSRRSTSASRATLPVGRRASAGSCCRPARCGSTPIRPSPSSKATRPANGGCRTPPRRCRRGCFGPAPGIRIVDLCAAPGGKAAELAAAGAEVTTVDRSAERLKLLAANFERLRLHSEIVVADALTFDAPPFDAVLLDAPCTATGTIRRHPDVAWIKRPGDLAPLVKLQAQLIDKAIALTRPGGAVVYCVCSLEPEEGEAQIAAVLRRNPDVRRLPIAADEIGGLAECVTPAGDLRTLPCHLWGDNPRRSGLDGFFAARLIKAG